MQEKLENITSVLTIFFPAPILFVHLRFVDIKSLSVSFLPSSRKKTRFPKVVCKEMESSHGIKE